MNTNVRHSPSLYDWLNRGQGYLGGHFTLNTAPPSVDERRVALNKLCLIAQFTDNDDPTNLFSMKDPTALIPMGRLTEGEIRTMAYMFEQRGIKSEIAFLPNSFGDSVRFLSIRDSANTHLRGSKIASFAAELKDRKDRLSTYYGLNAYIELDSFRPIKVSEQGYGLCVPIGHLADVQQIKLEAILRFKEIPCDYRELPSGEKVLVIPRSHKEKLSAFQKEVGNSLPVTVAPFEVDIPLQIEPR